MPKINIKPLSVNQAWQGRRYKTKDYVRYQNDVSLLLPSSHSVPEGGFLELRLVFGLSNKNADFDNPIKPFVDILQKKYGFNDKRIKRCIIEVVNVKKGSEFIEFNFKPFVIK